MSNAQRILKYVLIIINIGLTMFFAGGYYIVIGVVLAALSAIICISCKNNNVGYFLICSQIKKYDRKLLCDREERNSLLITIAMLILAMKIGVGVALIIEGGAVIVLAFCILLASGWLIEGKESGMSVGVAYYIAKIIMKIYLYCTSLVDMVAKAMVKIEFYILKIEER